MKKQLIASLVGGLILFIWQFLSWTMLPTHKSLYTYTPNEGKILESLGQNLGAEGTYMLPSLPANATPEQHEAMMRDAPGKPWAMVSYHQAMEMNMGMNMFRGFAIDFLAVWLLVWLLMKVNGFNMGTAVQASLAVGFIGYLTICYLRSIWFEEGSIGYLVDTVVSWGIVGAWLGWWLARE